MSDMTELRGWRHGVVALTEAIATVALFRDSKNAILFLSDPRWHRVGRIVGTEVQMLYGGGSPVTLDGVFEARCFTREWELRWRRDADDACGRGNAVLLSETLESPGEPWSPIGSVSAIATREFRYLVDSAVFQRQSTEEQFGPSHAQIDAVEGPYVTMLVTEYVSVESKNGNAFVAEERLLALESVTSERLMQRRFAHARV